MMKRLTLRNRRQEFLRISWILVIGAVGGIFPLLQAQSSGIAIADQIDAPESLPVEVIVENTNGLLQDSPTSWQEAHQKALVALKNKDFEKAEAIIQEALESNPDNGRILVLKGRIFWAQNKTEEGLSFLLEGAKKAKDFPRAYYYLGEAFFQNQDFLQARGALERYQKERSEDKDGILLLGLCSVALGDLGQASDLLLQLDQLDAIHPGYYFIKAALSRANEKPEEEIKHLQAAQTMYGNAIWAQYLKNYLKLFPTPKLPSALGEETKDS